MAQNNYAVLWFKGKELNMVFGLQLSISRVGSTVNFWVMAALYNMITSVSGYKALGVALYIGKKKTHSILPKENNKCLVSRK